MTYSTYFNPKRSRSGEPETLVDLLASRAHNRPDQFAYVFLADGEDEEQRLTYLELHQRASAIGAFLQSLDAAGRRVLLVYPPGLEYIAAFLGCLYAASVAVPAYPPRLNRSLARLEAVAADANPAIALTTRKLLTRAEGFFARSSILKTLKWKVTDDLAIGIEERWQWPDAGPATLALLQYTSGSTGAPKGVMLTHENLLHNSRLLANGFEYGPESYVVSWLPVYHDMGLIGGVLQPLYGGFPCTLMSPFAFLQRPARWLQAISRYRASISGGPNFAYELCVHKVSERDKESLDLSGWSVAFNGSEPVRAETLERFAEAFEACGFRREAFYPCYGLAEATLFVSGGKKGSGAKTVWLNGKALGDNRASETDAQDPDAKLIVSCGEPGQTVAIVDPLSLSPCASGRAGEVWVSGKSVAGGYWNLPTETERTFRARLANTSEGLFLRTGDLGFIKNGDLFVTGRLKDLIIIRGVNHYPQDIELTVERSHPSLRHGGVAAFTIEDGGQERLVVVIEVDPRACNIYTKISDSLRQAISEEHDLQVEAIALVKPGAILRTSSGKIQRRACRQAFLEGALETLHKWQAPATRDFGGNFRVDGPPRRVESIESVRELLVSVLADCLGLDSSTMDLDQPVNRLGIDSLKAAELAFSVEELLGAHLPMVRFLDGCSVRQIADEAHAICNRLPELKQRMAAQGETRYQCPLSKGQQALWFLHQLNPENAAYNISAAFTVAGKLDSAALQSALDGLANRHPALRAIFDAQMGGIAQRIDDRTKVSLERIDAGGWDEATLRERISERARTPFDLERGPLLRTILFRRSTDFHALLMVVHHIIADFWSLSALVRELRELYLAKVERRQPSLIPINFTYADYVRWQEDMLAGPEGERLRDFWREELAGELPTLNLLTDRPRPPTQSFRGASQSFRFDVELSRAFKALARSLDVTLYMALLASFQALLSRHTGQENILIGTLTSGRRLPDTAPLVGYFVNPLPLRADLSGNPTFAGFVGRTRQAVLASLEHQDYPFPLIVEQLKLERDPSRSPLFQVMFIMQRDHLETDDSLALIALDEGGVRLRIGDLRLESIPVNQGTTQFDITLIMAEAGGEIHGSLQYNADLFEPESVRQIAERFITLSRSIATEPNRRILDIDLLPEAERRRMLVDWNDTEGDYERDLCIHALFERQVEKSPQSPALVFENRQLTYSEMNRRANRLARRLREFGVGPEVTVGLCAERSIELIEGILAILKAGGAFVSLDPALPKERLAFMFEDSGARLLLTQKRLADKLSAAATIYLDSDGAAKFAEGDSNLTAVATPGNLGYVMYTSGSTGKPKGVMVTHRNVVNFFAGMDERIGCGGQDALLAVSSISFDISVLELLWTLANGGKVILIDEQAARGRNGKARAGRSSRPMEFSLFYFASDEMGDGEKYRLLLEGAKFADRNGFAAVWTPERHFHQFGGLYPNPAVCGAALAVLTERIRIRAGSVVAPLHNPIRVAEEWSLVDNLSGGRAGIAFASGWHADDFVFFPENYPSRKEVMFRDIETIRKLWRGEPVEVQGGAGNEIAVSIYPKPFQKELPIWLTATGSPDTFIKAGEMGAGVLTHLLGQSLDEVAEKIQLYRESLARNGRDRESGHVTLMLHTFIGEDRGEVREIVRLPFTNYLRSSVGLIANLAKSLDLPLDLDRMSEEDMEALLAYAFDRYFEIGALFGTIETCGRLVEKLREIGVDEVAGLIDFGVDANTVLASLNNLKALKDLHSSPARMEDYSLAAQSLRHGASMMQCTPSMMSMLSLDERVMDSLKELKKLMLGGEALLPGLAKRVKAILPARMMNMYGPTETTIWSTSHEVSDAEATISIGRPIANTQIYILDVGLDPVPRGCIGEIHIGGLGVARGYFNQPGLSAERFIPDRFAARRGALMYRTGDLGRYLPDGRLECVGRFDQQVKLRGFRIELGEIESALAGHKGVREAAVVMREDTPGDRRLVAYVATAQGTQVSASELLAYLRTKLPEYMAPSLFVDVKALPRSSNGKVDRKALPAPGASRPNLTVDYAPPRSRLEQVVASVWRQSLNLDKVGIHDNFFDLGGNSLLMAQAHSQLRSLIGRDFPLVKLIEHPTISSLAAYLAEERESGIAQSQNLDRARKQREGVRRQRQIIETKGGPR